MAGTIVMIDSYAPKETWPNKENMVDLFRVAAACGRATFLEARVILLPDKKRSRSGSLPGGTAWGRARRVAHHAPLVRTQRPDAVCPRRLHLWKARATGADCELDLPGAQSQGRQVAAGTEAQAGGLEFREKRLDTLSLIVVLLIDPGADPYLVLAVMKVESNFNHELCYRGAYGIMQLQVRGHRKCDARSRKIAKREGYLNFKTNVELGVRALRYWKRWCRQQGHKGHHWLLHYNQGYGKCRGRTRRCRIGERRINAGLSRYSKKVTYWHRRYRRERNVLFYLTQYVSRARLVLQGGRDGA